MKNQRAKCVYATGDAKSNFTLDDEYLFTNRGVIDDNDHLWSMFLNFNGDTPLDKFNNYYDGWIEFELIEDVDNRQSITEDNLRVGDKIRVNWLSTECSEAETLNYIIGKDNGEDNPFTLTEIDDNAPIIIPDFIARTITGLLDALDNDRDIESWEIIQPNNNQPTTKQDYTNQNLSQEQKDRFYVGREDYPEEPKIYILADILRYAEAKQRQYEVERLRSIGLEVYAAHEDKSINDKSKNTGDRLKTLAERIVIKDWNAIAKSNLIIAEPVSGIGSMSEYNQINGFNYLHKKITDLIEMEESLNKSSDEIMHTLKQLLDEYPLKKVLTHIDDMRLEAKGGLEFDDYTRTEYSINQYLNGVILSNTNGRGLMTIEEIFDELEKVYGNKEAKQND